MRMFADRGEPGTYAVRTPGSGSGKLPKPDVIAVDSGELLAIEVKSTNKPYVILNSSQVERLLEFCKLFIVRCPHCGAEIGPKPIMAARFLNREWSFAEIPLNWRGSIMLRMPGRASGGGRSLFHQRVEDAERASR